MTLEVSVLNEVWRHRGDIYLRSELVDSNEFTTNHMWYKEAESGRMEMINTVDELLKIEVAYFARDLNTEENSTESPQAVS